MSNNTPSLLVAVADHSAIVKVTGRANFTTSVSFKRLFGELRDRGFDRFILDLSECVTMDSTFLGVLAGTALSLSESQGRTHHNGAQIEQPEPRALRLMNPNQRVIDLLDNLGVSDLFWTLRCDSPVPNQNLAPAEQTQASPEELSRTCLEAHQLLMDINPENIPRFRDVAQFLAEDLKRVSAPAAANPEENGSPKVGPDSGSSQAGERQD